MTQPEELSPDDYIEGLPEARKAAIRAVRGVILANLPAGYEETVQHGMISYVIPLETYPVNGTRRHNPFRHGQLLSIGKVLLKMI